MPSPIPAAFTWKWKSCTIPESFVCEFATMGAASIPGSWKKAAARDTGACKECGNAHRGWARNWGYGAVQGLEPKWNCRFRRRLPTDPAARQRRYPGLAGAPATEDNQ